MKKYIIKSFILLMMIFMLVSCRDSANNVTESVNETATETPIFTKSEQEMFTGFFDYLASTKDNSGNVEFKITSNNTTLEVNVTSLIDSDYEAIKVIKINEKYVMTSSANGTLITQITEDTLTAVLFSLLAG